jgi:uncharacterized coiled-coil DUF342 family protein
MATKAELEQEVEQLKAQLAANIPPDVAALTAELDKLKSDLDTVSDERDKALADVAELKQVADQDAQKELELQQQIDSLKKDLQVAQDALATKSEQSGSDIGPDRVVLEGKEYAILWRSTVKDLVFEGHFKKHTDENHTALVIEKIGG